MSKYCDFLEKIATKWDHYVYSYVPKIALEQILREGLYGGEALLKRPDLLELAAKARNISAKQFKKSIEEGLKDSWSRDSLKGPNVVFHLIPDSMKLSKKHPTKKYKLVPIKINLTSLLTDFPETKIYGMELKPYDEKNPNARRHYFLNLRNITEFIAISPKDMWGRYNDIDDKGLYAPDVPHASIHCPNGIIPSKYIQKMTKQATTKNNVSHSEASKIIQEAKNRVKQQEALRKCFEKYNLDINEVDDVPVCFADIDVSARTDHGVIYLNWELLDDGFPENDHYLAHELTHYAQQTTGDGPTDGSTDDTYLDNKYEQEGFKVQTEFLSETEGDGVAKDYINQVLNYHDVPKSERAKKRKELLQLASKELKSRPSKTKEELLNEYREAIERGPQERHDRKSKFRNMLSNPEKEDIKTQLEYLLNSIEKAVKNPEEVHKDRKKRMLQL